MQSERIRLNVSGRLFEVTRQTLERMPTLADAPLEGELFVARSPKLFEEVLALVLDEKHPFPARYAYELDYYGVEYDPSKLDSEPATRLQRMEEEIGCIAVGISEDTLLTMGVYSTLTSESRVPGCRSKECRVPGCRSKRSGNTLYCEAHITEHRCNDTDCPMHVMKHNNGKCWMHGGAWGSDAK